MKTLLLVEDELDILENNRNFFTEVGYRVLPAETIAQAKEHLANEIPSAIMLDIMLPDGNGLDLLKELRDSGSKIPVIMLTAWGKSSDIAKGLKLGANDYVTKPFTYEELQARVETMFRNVEQIPERIEKGRITLKVRSMEIIFGNQKVKLPPVEFYLLQLFIENEGKKLKSEYLYKKVWGADMNDDQSAVRKAVSRLRKKIAGSGYTAVAVYGGGYRFERE
jgi:DNA-binding response OmpR family regulator